MLFDSICENFNTIDKFNTEFSIRSPRNRIKFVKFTNILKSPLMKPKEFNSLEKTEGKINTSKIWGTLTKEILSPFSHSKLILKRLSSVENIYSSMFRWTPSIDKSKSDFLRMMSKSRNNNLFVNSPKRDIESENDFSNFRITHSVERIPKDRHVDFFIQNINQVRRNSCNCRRCGKHCIKEIRLKNIGKECLPCLEFQRSPRNRSIQRIRGKLFGITSLMNKESKKRSTIIYDKNSKSKMSKKRYGSMNSSITSINEFNIQNKVMKSTKSSKTSMHQSSRSEMQKTTLKSIIDQSKNFKKWNYIDSFRRNNKCSELLVEKPFLPSVNYQEYLKDLNYVDQSSSKKSKMYESLTEGQISILLKYGNSKRLKIFENRKSVDFNSNYLKRIH